MSVRRLAPDPIQPKDFAFTAENTDWAKSQIAKYPPGRQASAVIPLLWKAQEQAGGWTPRKAIEEVAAMLDLPFIRVMEIATFYTMFNLSPVGRHHVQLCGTVPCHVCGAVELRKVCEERIGPQGTVSADGKLSWIEVECLGACCNAPMAQINFDYYEDLTPENFRKLLDRQLQVDQGALLLPQGPGLGFEFDEKAVATYAVEPNRVWTEIKGSQ